MHPVLAKLLRYEATVAIMETLERHHHWKKARAYCNQVGKPLLRIGLRRGPLEPPNGDVTLDVDPAVKQLDGGVHGDERDMPFSDKEFGACFNEHTLEHLETAEDVERAVNECVRVADMAIFLAPSPYSIWATFFCQTHHQRMWFDPKNHRIITKPNYFRTGLGTKPLAILEQSLVCMSKAPVVIRG